MQLSEYTRQLLALTFADSLYARLTPYSITSAPSIASLMASIVLPVQTPGLKTPLVDTRHRLHINEDWGYVS